MPEVYDKVNVKIKPEWLKSNLKCGEGFARVAQIVENHGLHTICDSGKCPNRTECWSRKTATFMVLGDVCTRACKFCATATGKPLPIDAGEPEKVARSIALMELKHAVITSVTRDDLADGGAEHWARVIEAVRAENPSTTVEVLVPDFGGRESLMDIVLAACPDIVGHNIETVRRLTPGVRSKASYEVSLKVLAHIAAAGFVAKSGLMAGLGETADEVLSALDDLREAGVSIVTLGQYLRPTREHVAVAEYVAPSMFEFYRQEALARGFAHVASGPLVRSSYMAEQAMSARAV
uniref:lipoyl synthase n=1 Tax=termite gut metagenome TaxID=433724 RepID=S0DEH9_9ZZZZ